MGDFVWNKKKPVHIVFKRRGHFMIIIQSEFGNDAPLVFIHKYGDH